MSRLVSPVAFIPSPSSSGFHLGPLFFHAYGIAYVLAVVAAVVITQRRWARAGGDPSLVGEVALWGFPAGLLGGRIYFLITTPSQVPPHWWGPFAIWKGGLGIWGGIAAGVAGGLYILRKRLAQSDVLRFMDAAEIIWNLSLAAFLVWLGHRRRIRPPGLLALYVAGYSGFRMFEETLRVDYSEHILGLRLTFFVATLLCVAGLAWFAAIQRSGNPEAPPAG